MKVSLVYFARVICKDVVFYIFIFVFMRDIYINCIMFI
jgi:hypothetical protein